MVKWSLRYKQVLFHALNKYWLDTDFLIAPYQVLWVTEVA